VILGTGCLGPRALDGPSIVAAQAATGLSRVLLVVGEETPPADLERAPAAGVRAPWAQRVAGLAAARAARCPRLVLELPDDVELDGACRGLHAYARSEAGLSLAILTPPSGPLADPATLSLLFEDLASLSPGYWHRPAAAFLAGQTDTDWIDALGRHLVGMSLDDVSNGETGLPPGLGSLDYSELSDHAGSSVEIALDVAPVQDVALLRFTIEELHRLGFA
jgi:hypothetical protein